jgi:RsiW-degrading membrane proteinase PrsW (M82 family)
MIYAIFIIFGLLPSLIWLLFYLRKDVHPESNAMVLKIFFYGMIAAIIAALVEIGVSISLAFLAAPMTKTLIYFLFSEFIVIALVEECSKFLIIKQKVISHSEFDEPVDAMIYMIIIALGFAAFENTLVLFSSFYFSKGIIAVGIGNIIADTVFISSLRFLGATFLHVLASGIVGYFLALSFFNPKKRLTLIIKGLGLAALLHGLFNISIIVFEGGAKDQNLLLSYSAVIFLIIFLSALGFFVSNRFGKLKKLKSLCLTRHQYE